MLAPIYILLFGQEDDISGIRFHATTQRTFHCEYFLALTQDQVKIYYKSYRTDDLTDMQAISDQKLAPGRTCLSLTKHR